MLLLHKFIESIDFGKFQTMADPTPADKEDKWGYDLYPERRGETPKSKWWQVAFFGSGRNVSEKINCERNVYDCFQNSEETN